MGRSIHVAVYVRAPERRRATRRLSLPTVPSTLVPRAHPVVRTRVAELERVELQARDAAILALTLYRCQ
jgi:hypothetical protein